MDTTREGRELLPQAIRTELRREGAIGADAIRVQTRESKGLTREEARHVRSYEAGDVVTFWRDYDRQGIEKGEAFRVSKVGAESTRVELTDRDGNAIDWRLDKWARGQVESFTEVEREFAAGERVQFIRNDREVGRVNGTTATVTAIEREQGAMTVREARGLEYTLQLNQTRDRHVRHGWLGIVHGSQGATADRSMAHLESLRANTVEARSAYVAISRARSHAAVYTDSKEKLADAIGMSTGERAMALETARSVEKAPRHSRGLALS